MSEHIIPRKTYFVVYVALLVLLFLTWFAAQYHFGEWNIVIALAIALAKTGLVLIYFMHLRYSSALVRVVACGGALWLAIAITYTLSDYWTRDWTQPTTLPPTPAAPIDRTNLPDITGEPAH